MKRVTTTLKYLISVLAFVPFVGLLFVTSPSAQTNALYENYEPRPFTISILEELGLSRFIELSKPNMGYREAVDLFAHKIDAKKQISRRQPAIWLPCAWL